MVGLPVGNDSLAETILMSPSPPTTASPLRREIRALSRLATPVVLGQLAGMSLWVVDLLMVGRVGVEALGAVSLGRTWVICTLIIGMGLVLGMDPVTSQAHGARDRRRVGLSLQWGLVVAVGASIPVALLWLMTEPLLLLTGQDPELSRLAHRYLLVQIPSVPFALCYMALRQWLQGRGLVRPAMWIALSANVLNVLANYLLIYGKWGFPELGVVGAGISTTITQISMFLGLAWLVVRRRLHRAGWSGWSREAFDLAGIRQVLGFGWPVATQLGLELWAFSSTTLLAGLVGEVELASHSVVFNIASVSFMVPLGIGIASVTRVGNQLGAGRPEGARRSAFVALGMGGGVMLVFALLFVVGRHQLPRLYSDDLGVIALTASILPIAAAFQLFDGLQVVGSGILRGAGQPRPAAVFNFIGYYVVALPLAAWWILGADGGIGGLWWCMCIGLALVAALLVYWVWSRGPGSGRGVPVVAQVRGASKGANSSATVG